MEFRMQAIRRYHDVQLHQHINPGMRITVSEERAVQLVDRGVASFLEMHIRPIDEHKKTICFYYHHMNHIGGVEVAIMNLIRKVHNQYNIIIAVSADSSDPHMLGRLALYSNQMFNLNHCDQKVNCDLLLVGSIYCVMSRRINYKHAYRWVHGSVQEIGLHNIADILIDDQIPEKVICVSDESARQFEEVFHVPAQTIHNIVDAKELQEQANLVPLDFDRSVLNLVTVSRVSPEKGMVRMFKMAGLLEDAGVKFKWRVVGSGFDKVYDAGTRKRFEVYPEVEFLGALDNPFPYMKNSDYLVLLSDYESYGLVIVEAIYLGTPCIVTDFKVASEVIGPNGFIVKKDLSDFDPGRLRSGEIATPIYPDDSTAWESLLSEI